tara:strand:+ start:1973 stop:2350 length:378 start_codon:yes stop_codon:yes gene_type:complete
MKSLKQIQEQIDKINSDVSYYQNERNLAIKREAPWSVIKAYWNSAEALEEKRKILEWVIAEEKVTDNPTKTEGSDDVITLSQNVITVELDDEPTGSCYNPTCRKYLYNGNDFCDDYCENEYDKQL